MLLEKSEELIALSEQKIKLQKYVTHQQEFNSRYEQINRYYQHIFEVVKTLRLFRSKELIEEDFSALVKPLMNLVESTLTQYQQNQEWIIDDNNFNRPNFESEVNTLTATLKRKLSRSWENYLNQNLPPIKPEILDLLSQIEDFKPTIETLRNLDTQIQNHDLPQYPEQLTYIDDLIQQLNNTWNTLNAENVPNEVLEFLKEAGSLQGAPFKRLTPIVDQWIKDHHLSKNLRIRLG